MVFNTDFIADGHLLQGVTVFQQPYSLGNSPLLEDQVYFVTVQALDSTLNIVAEAIGGPVKVSLHCSCACFVPMHLLS